MAGNHAEGEAPEVDRLGDGYQHLAADPAGLFQNHQIPPLEIWGGGKSNETVVKMQSAQERGTYFSLVGVAICG